MDSYHPMQLPSSLNSTPPPGERFIVFFYAETFNVAEAKFKKCNKSMEILILAPCPIVVPSL